MKRSLAVLAFLSVAGASMASIVGFTYSAQVTNINDFSHYFGAVSLGDTMTMTFYLDTANAVKTTTTGVYPDARYSVIGQSNYIITDLDTNHIVSDPAGSDYLYVTNTHPTIDFVDYIAYSNGPTSQISEEFEVDGPKGTLSSTAIPSGFPPGNWPEGFMRITYFNWSNNQNAEIDAQFYQPHAAPEPASIFALGLGVVTLVRRRKRLSLA